MRLASVAGLDRRGHRRWPGGLAYGINVAIYKSRLPVVAKVLLNIIVGLSAIGIWFVIVMVIRSMKK